MRDVRFAEILAMVAGIGLLAPVVGCSHRGKQHRPGCREFCERLEECSTPSSGKKVPGLSEKETQEAHAAFASIFGDRAACVEGCKHHHGEQRRGLMRQCLATSGCRAFFQCIDEQTNKKKDAKTTQTADTKQPKPGKIKGADAKTTSGTNAPALDTRAARCKRLCEMRRRCADTIVQIHPISREIPEQMKDEIRQGTRRVFADVAGCKKKCLAGGYRVDDTKECLVETDCKAFYRCFLNRKNKKMQNHVRKKFRARPARKIARKRSRPTSGLGRETCRRLCSKLYRCSDAFALIVGRELGIGIEDAKMSLIKQKLRTRFADQGTCMKQCLEPTSTRETIMERACLAVPGCNPFARCVMAASESLR